MDGATFRDALVEAKADELARLESPDFVDAVTDGERDAASVLRAAARSEHAARETFRTWADDESDPDVREAFDAVARQEDEHFRRVVERGTPDSRCADRAADAFDAEDAGPMHTYLRGREDAVERIAGGMVARPIVSLRTHARLVAFFEGRAATTRADLFRDLRAETAAVVDDGLELLDVRCADEDWERARMVGEYVVQLAYDDFVDALAR
ncbi:rubrerythrin family protein [Haloplanus sp. GCM10025708]|uniref:rubrerythrin family protein n=1 Tax=Haloferacaceae TaxID=1644056 RepID=UPI00360E735F